MMCLRRVVRLSDCPNASACENATDMQLLSWASSRFRSDRTPTKLATKWEMWGCTKCMPCAVHVSLQTKGGRFCCSQHELFFYWSETVLLLKRVSFLMYQIQLSANHEGWPNQCKILDWLQDTSWPVHKAMNSIMYKLEATWSIVCDPWQNQNAPKSTRYPLITSWCTVRLVSPNQSIKLAYINFYTNSFDPFCAGPVLLFKGWVSRSLET